MLVTRADEAGAWYRVPVEEFDRILDEVAEPVARQRAFAALLRLNTLYMVMRAGSGHLGSSFSACDIVTHLLLAELREPFAPDGDRYFSSKGHDVPSLYAALIGLRRLPDHLIHRLRRLPGLPGHPDVRTPHMPFNTGSLGMGISKAKGLVLADRLAGLARRVYVLTGDGELQEGQNWEALAGAAHRGMAELTVIVDHNKLQSDTWVRDVNDLGDLAARFASFGWPALRCDGHDFTALADAFASRWQRYPARPAVIIADTVKGAGCATFEATAMPAGEWRYRFHSGAPVEADYQRAHAELLAHAQEVLRQARVAPPRLIAEQPRAPRPAGGTRLVEVYGEELVARAEADPRVVALDADLVLDTGLIPFSRALPDRFVECGIAEQDMVSIAGGLAAGGRLPFVHSFSCFLHARANEQIYNNATEGRRVVYVGALAGLLPAEPGHSHQAVRDVSAVGAVPGLVVLEPANSAQVREAVRFCLNSHSSVYLRLTSTPVANRVEALPAGPLVPGVGEVVRPGGPVVAIGSGPAVLDELIGAADRLSAAGTALTVVNCPWPNRIDASWLRELAATAEHLFVVEHHYTHGGQADLVARALLELALPRPPRFHGIGLTDLPYCGSAEEVLRAHRLDAEGLAARIGSRVRDGRVPPAPGAPTRPADRDATTWRR